MEKAIATSGKKTSSQANLQAAASAAVSIPISAVESFLEVSAKVQPNPAPSSPSDAALCVPSDSAAALVRVPAVASPEAKADQTASSTKKAAKGKVPTQAALRQLQGRAYIKRLEQMIGSLRSAEAHGNRDLHFDDIVIVLLLGFFNSHIRSLRKLEMYSQVPGIKQRLGVDRVCRNTLSEGLKFFDPTLLRPLVKRLYQELPHSTTLEPDLQTIYDKLLAYDGSYFRVPADVLWAIHEKSRYHHAGRQVRLNLHFCLATGTPLGIRVDGDGDSEAQGLLEHIEPGMIYIGDRGIFSAAGVHGVIQAKADVVLRVRENVRFTVLSERELVSKDQEHRVLSDNLGYLTAAATRSGASPPVPLREIHIANPKDPDEPIRLITSMLDIPAHIVALIYLRRWDIEIFFRWLKVHANFEHMISHSPRGVETWMYVAIIGTLLVSLYTGEQPNTYMFTAMQLIMAGEATYEDMAPALGRLARERKLSRERLARKRAAKNIA